MGQPTLRDTITRVIAVTGRKTDDRHPICLTMSGIIEKVCRAREGVATSSVDVQRELIAMQNEGILHAPFCYDTRFLTLTLNGLVIAQLESPH
jgi:hypothetical protein